MDIIFKSVILLYLKSKETEIHLHIREFAGSLIHWESGQWDLFSCSLFLNQNAFQPLLFFTRTVDKVHTKFSV